MSGYEELTLEELSQVFTEETHAPLAASDMRDWLIALGAALGKKRLADKANAWSKWITGGVRRGCALGCSEHGRCGLAGRGDAEGRCQSGV